MPTAAAVGVMEIVAVVVLVVMAVPVTRAVIVTVVVVHAVTPVKLTCTDTLPVTGIQFLLQAPQNCR